MAGGLGEQGDREGIEAAFLKSFKDITAWEEDRLIGAGRMLSDGIF